MKFVAREDIAAPIEEVYAVLTDFEAMERAAMRRGAEVQRTDTLTQPGPGMAWEARFKFRGKERAVQTELAQMTPPEVIGLKSTVGGLHGLTAVDLVPLSPKQTRLSVAIELKPDSMPARVFLQSLRLAKGKLSQRFDKALRKFGRDLESGRFSK
ncbi:SRPBCC family protein [Rhodovulum adriaticum]|uniref:Carbon monoxide dehydrogenase subunit G n=1 Tax=Rhodovulum adriaticum TaxID=35804 RepID=A0A4R2NZ17_RHOAD|nr:SRPBCC family protein [Rhodovulum adriaticum]MBK1636117.1 hypothetical protein [Rhodovulum adriaticum]TCP27500.1 carbon monoxide dehydrogenase subunit G [Rhodovulum adriaticum]